MLKEQRGLSFKSVKGKAFSPLLGPSVSETVLFYTTKTSVDEWEVKWCVNHGSRCRLNLALPDDKRLAKF